MLVADSPPPSPPTPADLAQRIRGERIRLGLTQEAAAAQLGVSRSTYRQLEQAANPQVSTLLMLVRVLGMSPASLLPELVRESVTSP